MRRETAFKAIVVGLFAIALYLLWADHMARMAEYAAWKTPDQILGAPTPTGVPDPSTPSPLGFDPRRDFGRFIRDNALGLLGSRPPEPPPTGQPEATPLAPPPVQSPLDLRLLGTIVGDHEGYAFVADNLSRVEEFLRAGDSIGGAKVLAIRRNEVELERDGVKRVLTVDFSREGDASGAPMGPPAVPPPTLRTSLQPTPVSTEPIAPPESVSTIVASRAEVDRQLSNLNQLAREVRLQPYFERGKLAGFLLSNIKAGSFIQRMGGRDGDVVKAVNGGAIDSVQKAFSLYNTFRTNGQVNINVMRGGQSHTIQYNIQ